MCIGNRLMHSFLSCPKSALGRSKLLLGPAPGLGNLSESFNVQIHIEILRKRLIIYANFKVNKLPNIGCWNLERVFPFGKIDAKSFQNVQKYEIFIVY